jgi:hypothetical protein
MLRKPVNRIVRAIARRWRVLQTGVHSEAAVGVR